MLWLFAGTDGQIHLVDGVTDQAAKLGWGSDVASVKTACGSGWQVLATGAGENAGNSGADSVRAYEIADRAPVPVSAALDFPGEITALWTEAKGDSAVAVVRNRETGAMKRFGWRWLAASSLLLMALLINAGCSGDSSAVWWDAAHRDAGSASLTDPCDATQADSLARRNLLGLIFETLVTLDDRGRLHSIACASIGSSGPETSDGNSVCATV